MTKSPRKLAIALPVYNRAILLDFFLLKHAHIFSKYNVPLYISNNASTDETKVILERWCEKFPGISVSNFSQHLGDRSDEIFFRALSQPTEEYIWLMGDHYQISEEMLVKALNLIGQEPFDHMVVNLSSLHKGLKGEEYTTLELLTRDLPWLMACLSCNIFSAKLVQKEAFQRFYGTNFAQVGVPLTYAAENSFKFLFEPGISVVTLKCPGCEDKATGTSKKYFTICFQNFPLMVEKLPNRFTAEEKSNVLRSFYTRTPISSSRYIMNLRANGWLSSVELKIHQNKIKNFCPAELKLRLTFFALLPRFLVVFCAFSIKWIRRVDYRLRYFLGVWPEGR